MSKNPTGKHRRWPVVLLAVVAVVSTSGLILLIAAGSPGVGHFRTLDGRRGYEDAYTTAMAGLPAPTETATSRPASAPFAPTPG